MDKIILIIQICFRKSKLKSFRSSNSFNSKEVEHLRNLYFLFF